MDSRLNLSPRPEQRQPFEFALGREVVHRLQSAPTPIRTEDPREEVVAPGDFEGFEQLLLQRTVLDRHLYFDAAVEVALHEVRRTEPDGKLRIARSAEDQDSRVLQELTHQAVHGDVLRESGDARTQRAEGADFKTDLDAGRTRLVERVDDRRVREAIHFHGDAARWPAVALAIDELDHLRSRRERTHHDLLVLTDSRKTREEVEELAHVFADCRIGGQQPEV